MSILGEVTNKSSRVLEQIKNFWHGPKAISASTARQLIPIYRIQQDWGTTDELVFPCFRSVGYSLLERIASRLEQIKARSPDLIAKMCYGHADLDRARERAWIMSGQLFCGILVYKKAFGLYMHEQQEHELAHILKTLEGFPIGVNGPEQVYNLRWEQIVTAATHPAVNLVIRQCGGDDLSRQLRWLKGILRGGICRTLEFTDEIELGCLMFDYCRPFPDLRQQTEKATKAVSPVVARAFDCMWAHYEESKPEILQPLGATKFAAECGKDLGCSEKISMTRIEQMIDESLRL